ncbi:RNA ligase [Asticcacaulis sp. 201]|uniref:RNA ligase n=1 Tax=Asticcacaulis sp. 201 TaxID=3028787 RepID=UPI0029164EDE|nr:RNA ligase [Asticcacaulis sp. 201]MDV6330049.1 RNA ligase [Asticcacaulis sp. 201]
MRHLVIMRGAQGAGKSTFISEAGLEPYALSPDALRVQMGGVIMLPDGRIGINPNNDRKVWEEIERLLEQKMSRGEFILFDATFQAPRDFKMPMALAAKYAYRVTCLDFSGVPAETAKARNRMRPHWKQVPDTVIDRAYERFASSPLPKGMKVLRPDDMGEGGLVAALTEPVLDLNAYARVHHIGDLQGCYAPVAEYFRAGFGDGFRDDEFYIFVGDFLDRGIENDKVIRFVVDELLPRENVALIYGNHEYHIQRFGNGQPPVSKEFEHNTLPQLLAANFTVGEAKRLIARLKDVLVYTYGPHRVMVTHAGLSRVPEDLLLIPSLQMWKGTGRYEDPVDAAFAETMAGTNWLQVHGHRNSAKLPIQASANSFNLESEVEFGGCLSVMVLTAAGDVETIRVVNQIHRKEKASAFAPDPRSLISEGALAALKGHSHVAEKRFARFPGIASYNFTRGAFEKGAWDATTVSARGLFVDDDRRILARAYDKFFNLEERPETQMRNLERSLAFPLRLFVKENGFLGILGYDAGTDALFFASKSTPESEFAGWFRDILTAQVGEDGLAALKVRLRDDNLSLVFEVNDPVNDPHMIEYAQRHVVLLDAIHRTETFSRLGYADLQTLAAAFGLGVKQDGLRFDDFAAFKAWFAGVHAAGRDYTFDGRHIEGFVIEDAAGFMFKIKLPYYAFWKAMRGQTERIRAARQSGRPYDRSRAGQWGAEALAFVEWAERLSDDDLGADIITLRKRFTATG